MRLEGHVVNAGTAEGEALVSSMPLSFLGDVDGTTGIVTADGHDLRGESIEGRVLVFPHGKGSTVGSYVIYRLAKNGKAPAAIINMECETIIACGAVMSGIPCVDKVDTRMIKTGDRVKVSNGVIEVE
ncbi:MAG: DUF126 domain-containing protein [Candidatus Diapherotrites archaeon]|nr:DUF126 domain-containing protein [Candidatus Diapherotrites archaeon]